MMSSVRGPVEGPAAAPAVPLLPRGFDVPAFVLLVVGYAILMGPTFFDLSHTIWASDEQGHGPIILVVSWWLFYLRRHEIAATPLNPRPILGWSMLLIGVCVYAFGRSQQILMFQVGSQILVLASWLVIFRGLRALRVAWFPLFFLLFMVPLPGALVAAVTGPLKSAVSAVASNLLYDLGYPIGRSGVILTVGQYQLLVADACAGLNSMFTLEALGLLYMNVMNYKSAARNIFLAVLLIPISFVSNITRVAILVLVTYYFGDAAGQGFVHGFAGMVLFMVALMLMLFVDRVVGQLFFRPSEGLA